MGTIVYYNIMTLIFICIILCIPTIDIPLLVAGEHEETFFELEYYELMCVQIYLYSM